MTEKNILAYFRSPEEAQSAATKLRSLRIEDLSIERFNQYPGEGVSRMMNPINGDIPSLGKLTLDADFPNRSAGIMAAIDPSASGMTDGRHDELMGYDILMTVVVTEDDHEKAMRVLEACGARI